jgi:Protein of unknown function (DUF1579)
MKKLVVMLSLALVAPSLTFAQGASAPPPKPGPEHQKLAGLVGSWTAEGEITENPFGPAEKRSAKITTEWFSGNFAVVRHVEGTGSVSGASSSLDIIAYDGSAKGHTWYQVTNLGSTRLSKTSISGGELIVLRDTEANGKPYKFRGTLKGLGTDKLTWVSEYSEDGKVWKAYFHSTDTRVKPR